MAGGTLTTAMCGRLSTFARGVARPFSDSRRRRFVADMSGGLVVGGPVHRTAAPAGRGAWLRSPSGRGRRPTGYCDRRGRRPPPDRPGFSAGKVAGRRLR